MKPREEDYAIHEKVDEKDNHEDVPNAEADNCDAQCDYSPEDVYSIQASLNFQPQADWAFFIR